MQLFNAILLRDSFPEDCTTEWSYTILYRLCYYYLTQPTEYIRVVVSKRSVLLAWLSVQLLSVDFILIILLIVPLRPQLINWMIDIYRG